MGLDLFVERDNLGSIFDEQIDFVGPPIFDEEIEFELNIPFQMLPCLPSHVSLLNDCYYYVGASINKRTCEFISKLGLTKNGDFILGEWRNTLGHLNCVFVWVMYSLVLYYYTLGFAIWVFDPGGLLTMLLGYE